MKVNETAKFERFGSLFFLLLLGIGIGLPLVLSLLACLANPPFRADDF